MVTVVSTTPHASVIKEVICKNCGSTLQYVPADIKEEVHIDYTGGRDTYHHIICPPCGHKVNVKRY